MGYGSKAATLLKASRLGCTRDGAWAGFAARTVHDWLELLTNVAPGDDVDRTLLLAVLRGCLLDLLATGDGARTGAAVRRYLRLIDQGSGSGR